MDKNRQNLHFAYVRPCTLIDLGLKVLFQRIQIIMHLSSQLLIDMEIIMELMKRCNQNSANEIVN